ncbi:hypothetical protein PV326_011589 [Microctonus aethiopoides]|nr:hypothetical protein PV326_011589 [Microctonus aethiopoides]
MTRGILKIKEGKDAAAAAPPPPPPLAPLTRVSEWNRTKENVGEWVKEVEGEYIRLKRRLAKRISEMSTLQLCVDHRHSIR